MAIDFIFRSTGESLKIHPSLESLAERRIINSKCCSVIALVSRPEHEILNRKEMILMPEEIREATLHFETAPTVNCPHCGAKYHGRSLEEAARTGRVETCEKCGKKFKVVRPKEDWD
ncbi:hypothetical protein L6250_01310 [Candidatus Parcubacteria bacterium]|nr:hypothetical protein [Patescibacteria group bacterium]MBU4466443.1 hypothetical protein [Patescibacteria group bacterium]MCG2688254.1 hypothetical protein [Candidatus Parcubacteria bacterium]